MPLQPMPVGDSILNRSRAAATSYGLLSEKQLHVSHWFSDSVRVNAQLGADQVLASGKGGNFEEDYGDIRLPFPMLWLEWTAMVPLPDVGPTQINFAFHLRELEPKELERAFDQFDLGKTGSLADFGKSAIVATMMTTPVSGAAKVWVTPVQSLMFTDGNGQLLEAKLIPMDPSMPYEQIRKIGQSVTNWLMVPWTAISFMNCKNVTLQEIHRPGKKTKKMRRTRPGGLSYHTIVLPNKHRAEDSGIESGMPDARALHRVRGHFKTYTEEAPLMGKHVGTYWWGWQVRGDSANGVVISDYKLEE